MSRIPESIRMTIEPTLSHFKNGMIQNKVEEIKTSWPTGYQPAGQIKRNWADLNQHRQHCRTVWGNHDAELNPDAASFEPMESVPTLLIGQDL